MTTKITNRNDNIKPKKRRGKKPEQFAKFYIIRQIAKLYQSSIPIPKGLACIIIIWPCRQRKYSVQSVIILKIHLLLNEIAVRHSGVRHSRFAKKKTERKKIPPALSVLVASAAKRSHNLAPCQCFKRRPCPFK